MSDRRLRDLERRWKETGSISDRRAYEQARKRAGLPRLVVRHYIQPRHHGVLGQNEEVLLELDMKVWPHRKDYVFSACGIELWPRDLRWRAMGHKSTMRPHIYFTESPEDVTCGTCLRSIRNSEKKKKPYRRHYAPGSKGTRSDSPLPAVCGTGMDERYVNTHSHVMWSVDCPICKRIMKFGRRMSRAPSVR